MRDFRFLTCVSCALAALLVLPAQAADWRIDPAHSSAGFSVTHMMVSTVRGTFDRMTGSIQYDPAEPEKAS